MAQFAYPGTEAAAIPTHRFSLLAQEAGQCRGFAAAPMLMLKRHGSCLDETPPTGHSGGNSETGRACLRYRSATTRAPFQRCCV